jgi:hypothetical protein
MEQITTPRGRPTGTAPAPLARDLRAECEAENDRRRSAAEPRVGTPRRLAYLYREHIVGTGRERRLAITASFFLTYLFVRFITHSIRDHRLRTIFHDVGSGGGLHIHHMVYGIFGLMLAAYIAVAFQPRRRWAVLLLALLYGVSLALTLDEFALWLNLKDVYWERQGRESVDAVLIVGALISITVAGRGLLGGMARDVRTIWRDLRGADR